MSEQQYDCECGNCLSPAPHFDDCPVCGAAPHKGEGWRIECLSCGAVELGDRGRSVEHDIIMHRTEHCPQAEFDVAATGTAENEDHD